MCFLLSVSINSYISLRNWLNPELELPDHSGFQVITCDISKHIIGLRGLAIAIQYDEVIVAHLNQLPSNNYLCMIVSKPYV